MSIIQEWFPGIPLLITLLLMFWMGIMLFLRWRSQVYYYLTVTLAAAAAACYIILLMVLAWKGSHSNISGLLLSALLPVSASFVQLGFFHLFNQKKPKQLIVFAGSAGISILICLFSLFINAEIIELILLVGNLLFTAFIIYWAIPQLPKRRRFAAANLINIIADLVLILNLFMDRSFLVGIVLGLFAFYYLLMFWILFDRIIDLMIVVSTSSVTDGLTGLFNKNYFKRKPEIFTAIKSSWGYCLN